MTTRRKKGTNPDPAETKHQPEEQPSLEYTDAAPDHSIDDGRSSPAPRRSKRIPSAISGKRFRKRDMIAINGLRPSLAERIRADFPDMAEDAKISRKELARYRMVFIEELLQREHGEFTELDRQVAESISRQDTIAENIEEEFAERRTIGERLSDGLAKFGGSWGFLIAFAVLMGGWMGYNIWRGEAAFDAYPFILLNLVLSCIAAVQAPIIMMSQKRQEAKDRLRSISEYKVNLKAELEIRHLHEKMDYLISRQWQRMAEINTMQIEMLQERNRSRRTTKPKKRVKIVKQQVDAQVDPK